MTQGQAQMFTLAEAAMEIQRRRCATDGHDFDVVVYGTGDPRCVICAGCGKTWPVK